MGAVERRACAGVESRRVGGQAGSDYAILRLFHNPAHQHQVARVCLRASRGKLTNRRHADYRQGQTGPHESEGRRARRDHACPPEVGAASTVEEVFPGQRTGRRAGMVTVSLAQISRTTTAKRCSARSASMRISSTRSPSPAQEPQVAVMERVIRVWRRHVPGSPSAPSPAAALRAGAALDERSLPRIRIPSSNLADRRLSRPRRPANRRPITGFHALGTAGGGARRSSNWSCTDDSP